MNALTNICTHVDMYIYHACVKEYTSIQMHTMPIYSCLYKYAQININMNTHMSV